MMSRPRLTFLLDVDNTLIDNDAAKVELDRRLHNLLGAAELVHFWSAYEAVRHDIGVVNIPLTLQRFTAQSVAPGSTSNEFRIALATIFAQFPYEQFLFPETLEVIAALRRRGQVAILSDGDPVFQPRKIWRAGLTAAVDGAVMVVPRKTDHLAEATAFYPADRFVVVDDKPDILRLARHQLGNLATTVQIAFGRYAALTGPDSGAAIDLRLNTIGGLPDYVERNLSHSEHPSSHGD